MLRLFFVKFGEDDEDLLNPVLSKDFTKGTKKR